MYLFLSFIGRFFMWITGWKTEGKPYNEIKKKLFVVFPHTSNWDYPIGLMVKFTLKMRLNYLGKNTLFRPPFGWFFKAMGGMPVDRSKHNRMVDAIIQLFKEQDKLSLVITPEGTRKKVDQLKKGFYHIAFGAQVPIIFVSFDFKTKTMGFKEPYHVSGDYVKDMKEILGFFEGVEGKIEAYNSLPDLVLE